MKRPSDIDGFATRDYKPQSRSEPTVMCTPIRGNDLVELSSELDALFAHTLGVALLGRSSLDGLDVPETEEGAPEGFVLHERLAELVAEAVHTALQLEEDFYSALSRVVRERLIVERREIMEAGLHRCLSLGRGDATNLSLLSGREAEVAALVGVRVRDAVLA